MAFRPPAYSIDAEMVYISQHDPAWDLDKINTERRDLAKSGKGEKHPFDHWLEGRTRYDKRTLPREYLRDNEEPTVFHLRRLERNLAGVLMDQIESPMMATRATFDAFKHGVKRVDGLDLGADSIDWPGEDPRKVLQSGDLDVLERAGVHLMALKDVGLAVIRGSWILTDAEKKPSGS